LQFEVEGLDEGYEVEVHYHHNGDGFNMTIGGEGEKGNRKNNESSTSTKSKSKGKKGNAWTPTASGSKKKTKQKVSFSKETANHQKVTPGQMESRRKRANKANEKNAEHKYKFYGKVVLKVPKFNSIGGMCPQLLADMLKILQARDPSAEYSISILVSTMGTTWVSWQTTDRR
jgi:hypothetical protein